MSESVVTTPTEAEPEKHEQKCEEPQDDKGHTTQRTIIDYVHKEPPTTPKPLLIFDVQIQHAKFSKKLVRYVRSCKVVTCFPPLGGGFSTKKCEKLPKGTVPKELVPKGVTDACCSVWKCPGGKESSMHYGKKILNFLNVQLICNSHISLQDFLVSQKSAFPSSTQVQGRTNFPSFSP